jgi:hypothetical protein
MQGNCNANSHNFTSAQDTYRDKEQRHQIGKEFVRRDNREHCKARREQKRVLETKKTAKKINFRASAADVKKTGYLQTQINTIRRRKAEDNMKSMFSLIIKWVQYTKSPLYK